MGVTIQEILIERDEGREVDNGSWGKVMELSSEIVEERPQEGMGRHREASLNVGVEQDVLVLLTRQLDPAIPNLGFTICHLASFSLGFPEPEGHLI